VLCALISGEAEKLVLAKWTCLALVQHSPLNIDGIRAEVGGIEVTIANL
jgi:hypothetical protein